MSAERPGSPEMKGLVEELEQFRQIIEATPDLVGVITAGRFSYLNQAARDFFGLRPDSDASAIDPPEMLHPRSRPIWEDGVRALERRGSWSGSVDLLRDDAIAVPVSVVLLAKRDDAGRVLSVAAIARDLSAQKAYEAELESLVVTDELTGLANRRKMLDAIHAALAANREQSTRVGLLVLDVDGFQRLNDTLGQATGDRILIALGDRVQSVLGPNDRMARLGSDTFAVLTDGLVGAEDLITIGERIQEAVARPFVVAGRELMISVCAGASLPQPPRTQAEAVLQDAEAAVVQAKRLGRGRIEVFDPVSRRRAAELLDLEQELRKALQQDRLQLVYQPEFWLRSDDPVCVEALLRWTHPELGPISPEDFIPIAEATGLIVPIGSWVLGEACRQLNRWDDAGLRGIPVSVNVSPKELSAPGFVERTRQIVADHGLSPARISLEITESAAADESRAMLSCLFALEEAGFTLILDDFGTGYSSLSKLRNLPFSVLKIDKAFVLGLEESESDRALVDATIRMAHALGRTVVAEGVETAAHAEILRGLDCEIGQGWYFGRPGDGESVAALFRGDDKDER